MDTICEEHKTCMVAITKKFKECETILHAMGDTTRQLILCTLLESDFNGIRVNEIATRIHLSRPSVSHHLQILKQAGIINMRRVGTRNYYYLDSSISTWNVLLELSQMVSDGIKIIEKTDARKQEE